MNSLLLNSTNSINAMNSMNAINAMNANWYPLYTRSRHEKFVELALIGKGIESFTPTVVLRKRWSDRIKFIEQPLFKSYCFAKFSLEDKITVVSQPGVANIVHFKNQYIPIQDSVIDSLRILIKSKVKIDPHPYLKIGDKIAVKEGSLKGVEGYIIEKRNKNAALVISIEAIASSVKCIVDIADVESA